MTIDLAILYEHPQWFTPSSPQAEEMERFAAQVMGTTAVRASATA